MWRCRRPVRNGGSQVARGSRRQGVSKWNSIYALRRMASMNCFARGEPLRRLYTSSASAMASQRLLVKRSTVTSQQPHLSTLNPFGETHLASTHVPPTASSGCRSQCCLPGFQELRKWMHCFSRPSSMTFMQASCLSAVPQLRVRRSSDGIASCWACGRRHRHWRLALVRSPGSKPWILREPGVSMSPEEVRESMTTALLFFGRKLTELDRFTSPTGPTQSLQHNMTLMPGRRAWGITHYFPVSRFGAGKVRTWMGTV